MDGVDLLQALWSISSYKVKEEIREGYANGKRSERSDEELYDQMSDNAADSSEQCAAHVARLLEDVMDQ